MPFGIVKELKIFGKKLEKFKNGDQKKRKKMKKSENQKKLFKSLYDLQKRSYGDLKFFEFSIPLQFQRESFFKILIPLQFQRKKS